MSKEYCSKHHLFWDTDEWPCCPHYTHEDRCGSDYDPPLPQALIIQFPKSFQKPKVLGSVDGLTD